MPKSEPQEEATVIVKAPTNKRSLTISLSTFFIIVLLIGAGGMFWAWNPWNGSYTSSTEARITSVTGEAKLTAEPDEFVFNPTYEFKNASKDLALAELTKKSDEVVKKLKDLGVAESKIKTNSSGYDYGYYYDISNKTNNYNLQVTVTLSDRSLTQKVQDYLITTTPSGSVSPTASFSESKRKELENKARDEATKDARSKADQSAKNLGFKLGKVKSVDDGSGFGGGIEPLYGRGGAEDTINSASPSLSVLPGENDLQYSVTVVYYIK